ncbi:MarR family transcriptional regulator [Cellulomonas hominis]|uniref:MarR family winged helix-turn-helix transcriptional regulator n=1 Tax=Cellulomonas hominis TaxID=156981 RepID=UPI001C1083C3|nr:MarR family transcriptional regulator [Cellulomonas hominis]MBU5421288.1 MarR family transcriptional regulator [Cellulomonas hominis]
MPDPARPPLLTGPEDDFIRTLVRTFVALPRALDADLRRDEGLTSSEYFVLLYLDEAPGGRLRMGELAAATALSLSATTRVVGLLEGAGLVERRRSAEDGRGSDAVLTPRGRKRFLAAWPAHVASLRRHVFDRLDDVELEHCTAALRRIADH